MEAVPVWFLFSIRLPWRMACFSEPGVRRRNAQAALKRRGVGTLWKTGMERVQIMSCRIDRVVSGDDGVVFRVSGRITAQGLGMLRGLLVRESAAVALDLKSVLLIDREAVTLLASRDFNGLELRNCPAYIREWIARERVQSTADGSRPATQAREDIEDV